MDKMRMETQDLTAANVEKIGELFPNCITEARDENGKLKKAVNFDMLRQMLSGDVVEDGEAYEFTWVGKKAAIIEANKPIRKTLRPCPEESVDWDTTENLYIEGDNLDVLKLLQESYLGKIKEIFIDPPYNTGSDRFVYPDNYRMSVDKYETEAGFVDVSGNTLFAENANSNPRFHSLWCSMMYSRLMLARNLLTEDGIIFITLDDGENANARHICNEIFGETNFITEFIWEKKKKPSFLHRNVGKQFDYILCYAKNALATKAFSVDKTTQGKKYPVNNAGNGRNVIVFPPKTVRFSMKEAIFEPQDMSEGNIYTVLKNRVEVEDYFNITEIILDGEWRYSQEKINEIIANGEEFLISKSPFRPNHVKVGGEIKKMKNVLSPSSYSCETNEDAAKQIIDLCGATVFDNPKPVKLVELLLEATTYDDKEATVMDFFSGSATTAHATFSLNAKDDGKRRFIMVQFQENLDKAMTSAKPGTKQVLSNAIELCNQIGVSHFLTEIGKERIRRAGAKIKEENPLTAQNLDTGFRVFKLDESNMNDVYYTAGEYTQDMLSMMESNVKSDRTDLDLLFGCLLEWGLPLSMPYKSEKIEGFTVHTYNDGDLIACFDENIPEAAIKEIARRQPLRAVFRDSSFSDSPAKINVGEIFKMLAPNTIVKVL
ncbi:site-specific DNA-methyltransferase [bacterium]|nr:site-specific DNA-methyltransferase [bacterium]